MLNDLTATKLYRDLCQLRQRTATEKTINEAQLKYRTYVRWLKTQALARWKEEWFEERYAKIIQTRGRISQDRSLVIDRAQALFRVMPERGRLADMITSNEPRTRAQRLSAVQDILSLCTRNFEVMYRPAEEPVDGACPVCRCKLPEVKRSRADHIHACRRKENATRAVGGQSAGSGSVLVEYCFLCFKWFAGATAWEEHCRGHLTSTTPKWCAVRVYCHTMISPGFCPFCLARTDLLAAQRLRQWNRNCTLMKHVEKHCEEIRSWPTTCLCGTEVEGASDLRHHLSDAHGLWKAEWRMFGRKRASEEDQNTDDPEHTLDAEDAGQTSPRESRKRTHTGDKFIEWSPSRTGRALNPPPSRAKASSGRNGTPKAELTETTFTAWSPAAKARSPRQPSGEGRGPCTGGPAITAQLSPNHYPDLDWDSRSVTAVDESDGAPEDQALLELPPDDHYQCDGLLTGDFPDDALWLDGVSWTENGTTEPSSVSTPMTTSALDAFEDVLDPALLCSEASTSQPPASEFSQEIQTPPSDGEDDDLDLPSLDSLLPSPPAPFSSESEEEPGTEKPTKSTVQIQGWTEAVGPADTPILQELRDRECGNQARRTRDKRKKQCPVTRAAVRKRAPVPDDSILPKNSCRVAAKRPRCRAKGLQRPERRSKRLNKSEPAESREARELKEAETEWAQRGYPRICWRRLNSRLQGFSSALRDVLGGIAPSFYRAELESAVARREGHKYRCMENATAGYYGPRGQQIL